MNLSRLMAAIPVCALFVVAVRADTFTLVDQFTNEEFAQTSSAAPTAPSVYFFSLGGTLSSTTADTTVTATFPGTSSPFTIPITGTNFNKNSSSFASLGDLQAAFNFGTYTFSAAAIPSATLNYSANHFDSTIPALSAASYTSLQGLNPANSLTINFDSFTAPDATVNETDTFFTIVNTTTGTVAFSQAFLPNSTTSVVLPANTLAANTGYQFDLDFSNRINGSDAQSAFTLDSSEVRTDGFFTTGAAVSTPEPSTIAFSVAGMLMILTWRRKSNLKPDAADVNDYIVTP